MMILSIAWKNLWRVPRRTIVILTAVVVGIWAMFSLVAVNMGMMDQMVSNSISTMTGHLQIHARGYFDDPVIENSISDVSSVIEVLGEMPGKAHWSPRVRVPGVVNNARNSAGITLVGIDPGKEISVSSIGSFVRQGRYLTEEDKNGIVIGGKLAQKFDTKLGKKLILMAQDTTGDIASEGFRIVGIFETEIQAAEEAYVFIPLKTAQSMLKLGHKLSEICILAPDRSEVEPLYTFLTGKMPQGVEVRTWEQLEPLIKAMVGIWEGFIYLWYLVVFVAIGFGLVNTMLAAVLERIREFGMLKAVGMKPRLIVAQVMTESFVLLLVGMAAGNVLGWIMVKFLAKTGINLSAFAKGLDELAMPHIIFPVIKEHDIVLANVMILVLGLLICLYPAIKGARISPVKAMTRN